MPYINKYFLLLVFSSVLSACSFDKATSADSSLKGNTKQTTSFKEGYLHLEGVDLFYKTMGEGDPVVILHGGPGLHHGYLTAHLPELSKKHQIVFYDQRGSGRSVPTALDEKNINLEVFVDDIERLRASLGLGKISLVGHSWGGFLAMQYAIRYPQNLASLVVMNSLPATSKGISAFMDEWYKRTRELEGELNTIQNSEAFAQGDPQKVAEFFRLIFSTYLFDAQKTKDLPLNFERASALSGFQVSDIFNKVIYGGNIDLTEELHTLTVPTLVVHGDYDPIPAWTAEEVASTIPNAELYVIDRCGHFPDIEHPDKLLPKLDSFISSHFPESF